MVDDTAQEPSQIEVLALSAASGGQTELDALINAFVAAVVVVPSASDPSKGAFEPVLVNIEGTPHMLVCDSLTAARATSNLAAYVASMRGIDVVRGVAPGHALFVQTPKNGFAIDEGTLNKIRTAPRP